MKPRRVVLVPITIFFLTACSRPPVGINFAAQPVPQEISQQIKADQQKQEPSNELTTDAQGNALLKVGLYGMEITTSPTAVTIAQVADGSLAQRAAASQGQRVEKINGQPALKTFKKNGAQAVLDFFSPTQPAALFLVSPDEKQSDVLFIPPLEYDFNRDGVPERLAYVYNNNPYQSQLVITPRTTQTTSTSFDFSTKLSFLPEIEKYQLKSLSRDNLIDLNSEGASELSLTLQKTVKPADKYALLLQWKDGSFAPISLTAPEGSPSSALFLVYEHDINAARFETLDIDEQEPLEFVWWKYEKEAPTATDPIYINVTAQVFHWESGAYRYDKVLSGQFARQKQLELLGGDGFQE